MAYHKHKRTIEAARRAQDGLDDAQDALEALPDVGILGLDRLFLTQHNLQVMVRLLALEVPYALIQAVNLRLGALSYGALGFAVVCALPGKLLGCEVGDATRRRGARAALLRRRLRGTPIGGISLAIIGRAVDIPGHFIFAQYGARSWMLLGKSRALHEKDASMTRPIAGSFTICGGAMWRMSRVTTSWTRQSHHA